MLCDTTGSRRGGMSDIKIYQAATEVPATWIKIWIMNHGSQCWCPIVFFAKLCLAVGSESSANEPHTTVLDHPEGRVLP